MILICSNLEVINLITTCYTLHCFMRQAIEKSKISFIKVINYFLFERIQVKKTKFQCYRNLFF